MLVLYLSLSLSSDLPIRQRCSRAAAAAVVVQRALVGATSDIIPLDCLVCLRLGLPAKILHFSFGH